MDDKKKIEVLSEGISRAIKHLKGAFGGSRTDRIVSAVNALAYVLGRARGIRDDDEQAKT